MTGADLRGYRSEEMLAQGGYGAVYRAHQEHLERDVAIKVIRPEHANKPEFVQRFDLEAQLVARLEHPHIVPLYDYWRDPSGAYLVMRFLRGGTLEDALSEGPWSPQRVLAMMEQLAPALDFAHRNHVVHRDLKPANIFLDTQGNTYLADFGIAKDVHADEHVTQTGDIVGSPAYMAPEQVRSGQASTQTDIYSLALLLYRMLTGQHPYPYKNVADLLVMHLSQPLPAASETQPEVPVEVDACLQRAAAKQPADRYDSALAFLADLRAAIAPATVAEVRPETLPPLRDSDNPYVGLRPFREGDADKFHGRSSLVDDLLDRFERRGAASRLLVLVGPSGSGKSSVVRAGILPALRRGDIEGSKAWLITDLVPGTQPLAELTEALMRVAVSPHADPERVLRTEPNGLTRLADAILPTDATLVLVVDQLEELFVSAESESDRDRFLDLIAAAAGDRTGRIRIVATLRADFYDRPLGHPELATLLRTCTEPVPPLTEDELLEAVRVPAEQVGLQFAPDLLPAIVADVQRQAGSLPLLQFALRELYDEREGRLLTLAAYRRTGGVMGALVSRAEAVFHALDEPTRHVAQQIFLRLVTLGEGSEDTRRRVGRSELLSLGSREAVQIVLESYGFHRILTFDRDPQQRLPTVELAHEALIRTWDRLRSWVQEARADLRLQQRLTVAAEEWRRAERDPSYLLSGSRLTTYEEWSATTPLTLTDTERAYLEASSAERARQEALERERHEREVALEARSRRFLQGMVGVFLVAAVVASGLAFFASRQRQAAITAQREAEANFAEAQGARLTREAERALDTDRDPETAALLALASLDFHRTPEADEVLQRVTRMPMGEHILHPGSARPRIGPDGAVTIGGAERGSGNGAEGGAADSPTGTSGWAEAIDAATAETTGRFELPAPFRDGLAFGSAGSGDPPQLFAALDDNSVGVWRTSADTPVWLATYPEPPRELALSTDGRRAMLEFGNPAVDGAFVLVLATSDGRVLLDSRGEVTEMRTSGSFTADGSISLVDIVWEPTRVSQIGPLAVAGRYVTRFRLLGPDDDHEIASLEIDGTSSVLAASHNGRRILATDDAGGLALWDLDLLVEAWRLEAFFASGAEGGERYGAAFIDGDRQILVHDGTDIAKLDAATGVTVSRLPAPADAAFGPFEVSPTGVLALVAETSSPPVLAVLDVASMLPIAQLALGPDAFETYVFVEPDRFVTSGGWGVRSWSVSSLASPRLAILPAPVAGVSATAQRLVAGGEDGSVVVTERAPADVLEIRTGGMVTGVALSGDGSTVAVESSDATGEQVSVVAYATDDGRPDLHVFGPAAAFSSDGTLFVAIDDGTLPADDGSTAPRLRIYAVRPPPASGTDPAAAGAAGPSDPGRVTPLAVWQLEPEIVPLDIAFLDGDAVALLGRDGETTSIWIWRNLKRAASSDRTPEPAASFAVGGGDRLAAASSGTRIAVGNAPVVGAVALLSGSGDELRTLTGHSARLTDLHVSAGADVVLTASSDGTARLWDTSTGDELRRFVGNGGAGIRSAAFADERANGGTNVVLGDVEGHVIVTPTRLADLRAEVCGRLLRDLSPTEMAAYGIPADAPSSCDSES